ncbi:hypothetical protein AB0J80_37610 [Actinoplanes sp. NPDC049548]|uniref:hypothetical protein n=1 Tax=Actinoplanes sp. NPDC049548 TaxID=3155152 RepID=UPI0034422739
MENDDVTISESPPPIRSTWLRAGIVIASVLAVALIGAGYLIGAGSRGDGAEPKAGAAPAGDLAQYVACMRRNGVANFPEPPPDGRLRISPQDGIDTSSQTFKDAEAACKSLMPNVGAQQVGPIPSGSASFVGKPIDTRAYVSCMRKNGVPDFPEPVNGMFSYDARTPQAQAADKICRQYLPSDAPRPAQ